MPEITGRNTKPRGRNLDDVVTSQNIIPNSVSETPIQCEVQVVPPDDPSALTDSPTNLPTSFAGVGNFLPSACRSPSGIKNKDFTYQHRRSGIPKPAASLN